jgi:hypothetical protein
MTRQDTARPRVDDIDVEFALGHSLLPSDDLSVNGLK